MPNRYRYQLKAKIAEAGYRSTRELCRVGGLDETYVSKVLNGWMLPGPTLEGKLANMLGLTIREVRGLVGSP